MSAIYRATLSFNKMLFEYIEHNEQSTLFIRGDDLINLLPDQYKERMLIGEGSDIEEIENAYRQELKMRIMEFVTEQRNDRQNQLTDDDIAVLQAWIDAACGLE